MPNRTKPPAKSRGGLSTAALVVISLCAVAALIHGLAMVAGPWVYYFLGGVFVLLGAILVVGRRTLATWWAVGLQRIVSEDAP